MGCKAIAIPVYYPENGPPLFCVVRDRRFRDWTFITGGCRKREVDNPIRCALRELSEETRGVIKLFDGKYQSYSFNILMDGEYHTYNVFVFPIDCGMEMIRRSEQEFDEHKRKTEDRKRMGMTIRLVQDENDYMKWMTLGEFKNKKLWHVASGVAQSDLVTRVSKNANINWVRFSREIVYGDRPPTGTSTRLSPPGPGGPGGPSAASASASASTPPPGQGAGVWGKGR